MDRDPLPTVTLLGAAVDADGSVWFAADTRSVARDACSGDAYDVAKVGKLYEITKTVVWGLYGDGLVATRLNKSLMNRGYLYPGALIQDMRTELLRLNGLDMNSGVLLGGRLKNDKDEPVSFIAWINAADCLRESDRALFAGNGRIAAQVAYDSLAVGAPHLTVAQRLMLTMKTAIEEMPTYLGLPLLLWHVKKDMTIDHKCLSGDEITAALG